MTNSPPKPCNKAGCHNLVSNGQRFCSKHLSIEQRDLVLSSGFRGYGYRWRKARERYLKTNPLCVQCLKKGFIVPATEVDHIIPHRLGREKLTRNKGKIIVAIELFWNEGNWQALCKSCHARKTGQGY